jgi:hypothetical protein
MITWLTTQFMLGVEPVDNALFGSPEITLDETDSVNGQRNTERRFHKQETPSYLVPENRRYTCRIG